MIDYGLRNQCNAGGLAYLIFFNIAFHMSRYLCLSRPEEAKMVPCDTPPAVDKAPYSWNAKGFSRDKYYHLVDKKDAAGEYIWGDDLLPKFARDHKVDLFLTRQAVPGLLNARGELRKRALRQTEAQRNFDRRYIKDIPELRRLTNATKAQIIYNRQRELEDKRTDGAQRMKRKRKNWNMMPKKSISALLHHISLEKG